MTREQVFEALSEIFQETFDDESITVHDETTASDIEGWDSLEHINLIAEVENRFEMEFTMGEVNGMRNVGEMVDIILGRTKL